MKLLQKNSTVQFNSVAPRRSLESSYFCKASENLSTYLPGIYVVIFTRVRNYVALDGDRTRRQNVCQNAGTIICAPTTLWRSL